MVIIPCDMGTAFIGYSWVSLNSSDNTLELPHKPDEYVGVEDMINSAKVMATAINEMVQADLN